MGSMHLSLLWDGFPAPLAIIQYHFWWFETDHITKMGGTWDPRYLGRRQKQAFVFPLLRDLVHSKHFRLSVPIPPQELCWNSVGFRSSSHLKPLGKMVKQVKILSRYLVHTPTPTPTLTPRLKRGSSCVLWGLQTWNRHLFCPEESAQLHLSAYFLPKPAAPDSLPSLDPGAAGKSRSTGVPAPDTDFCGCCYTWKPQVSSYFHHLMSLSLRILMVLSQHLQEAPVQVSTHVPPHLLASARTMSHKSKECWRFSAYFYHIHASSPHSRVWAADVTVVQF